MTKKIFSLCIVVLFTANIIYAQSRAKNVFYIDFGASIVAVGVGINYERMLGDNFSIRIGANIGKILWTDAENNYGISFPLTLNYMTSGIGKFEIGGGAGLRINYLNKGKLEIMPAGRIGYRHQPEEKGFFWRGGFEFPANTYLSVGSLGFVK
jgi:hypothetical protein